MCDYDITFDVLKWHKQTKNRYPEYDIICEMVAYFEKISVILDQLFSYLCNKIDR